MTHGSWEKKILKEQDLTPVIHKINMKTEILKQIMCPYSYLMKLQNFVLSMLKPTADSAAKRHNVTFTTLAFILHLDSFLILK